MDVIYLLVVSTHLDLIAGMGFNLSSATGCLCDLGQLTSPSLMLF